MLPFFYLFLLWVSTIMFADGRCGHPGFPKHGLVLSPTIPSKNYYKEGDLVFYTCNTPFVLYGSIIRQCQHNGSWSEEVPFCLRRTAGIQKGSRLPLALLDGNLTTCASFLNFMQFGNITLSLSDRPYLIALNIFLDSGRVFTSPFIDCKGRSQTITFLQVLVDGNEEIQLNVCDSQYVVNLMFYTICEIEILEFKGSKDCGTPDSPADAYRAKLSEMTGHVTSKITCFQDRFVLVGNETRVCDDFGKWSEEQQYCKALYCEDLMQVEKDSVLNLSYEPPLGTNVLPAISTTARYSCSEGFILKMESDRKCLSNGTWSGNKPLCIPDGENRRTWNVIAIAGISTLGFILLAFIGYFILLLCRKHSKKNKQIITSTPINRNNASFARVTRERQIYPAFSDQSYCYVSPDANYTDLYNDASSSLPLDSARQADVTGLDSSTVPKIVFNSCLKSQTDRQPSSNCRPEYESCSYSSEQLYMEIAE